MDVFRFDDVRRMRNSPRRMTLTLRGITKTLGHVPILRGVDLKVADGEFVVLVGPSGCGKSTLLRTIAGLETVDSGSIAIAGNDVTSVPPRERDVAMVFQSYALYPHLTVRENLEFGLKLRGTSADEIKTRVFDATKTLQLDNYLDRFPRQLSGGQRQRVAMGRAIVRRPKLFLFDEPLSNLDAALRAEVRVEIKRLHERLKTTMIYVTHDQVEAMTLADRVVVMQGGGVQQVGAPMHLYDRPHNGFVAEFLGSPRMNFFEDARVVGEFVQFEGLCVPAPRDRSETYQDIVLGVRPEDLVLGGEGDALFRVDVVERLGVDAYAYGLLGSSKCCVRLEPQQSGTLKNGDSLRVRVREGKAHFFHPESGEALR